MTTVKASAELLRLVSCWSDVGRAAARAIAAPQAAEAETPRFLTSMKLSSSRILAADVLAMFDAVQNGECRVQYPEMAL